MVDVNLLSDLSNQILVERSKFAFIAYMKYNKLSLFCSNFKMINHDLSNCIWLQQDTNVISSGEKTVDTKIQHYRPHVVSAPDGTKGSLSQVVKPVVEPMMELMVEPVIQSFIVQLVARSQPELVVSNHDNICIVNGSSLIKNLDGGVHWNLIPWLVLWRTSLLLGLVCKIYNN